MHKISICTVCMNRLSHLRETLPVNIMDNMNYPGIEFILLDYNSGDGMENWVRSAMSHQIESGILKYYKTYEPEYFRLSHSKNMALKLASGDIICMVDADNYAGPDYAAWINTMFSVNGRNTIITTLEQNLIPYRDQGGKLCFERNFFHSAKGFDESLVGYGVEDLDLVNRLEKAGGRRVFIKKKEHLKYIGHSDIERLKNFHLINNLENLYIQVFDSTNTKNRVLYLLKDATFLDIIYEFEETLKTSPMLSHAGWTVKDNGQKKGNYVWEKGELSLSFHDKSTIIYRERSYGILQSSERGENFTWKKISPGEELYYKLVKAYGECKNRLQYSKNDKDYKGVNPDGWGQGAVYLNFDQKTPIQIT